MAKKPMHIIDMRGLFPYDLEPARYQDEPDHEYRARRRQMKTLLKNYKRYGPDQEMWRAKSLRG